MQACYAEQWLRFGTGLAEELSCSAPALADVLADSGGRLDAVIEVIASLPHFRQRLGGGEQLDAPPVGSGSPPPIDDPTEWEPGGGDDVNGTPGLSTDISLNDWGSGYCADITVTNNGTETVLWEVVLTFDGTINNTWNAVRTDLGGGQYLFAGVEWNDEVVAGGSVNFGLCADR